MINFLFIFEVWFISCNILDYKIELNNYLYVYTKKLFNGTDIYFLDEGKPLRNISRTLNIVFLRNVVINSLKFDN